MACAELRRDALSDSQPRPLNPQLPFQVDGVCRAEEGRAFGVVSPDSEEKRVPPRESQ